MQVMQSYKYRLMQVMQVMQCYKYRLRNRVFHTSANKFVLSLINYPKIRQQNLLQVMQLMHCYKTCWQSLHSYNQDHRPDTRSMI
jgi:hypothetical protein